VTDIAFDRAAGAFRLGDVFGRCFLVVRRRFLPVFLVTAAFQSPLLLLPLLVVGSVEFALRTATLTFVIILDAAVYHGLRCAKEGPATARIAAVFDQAPPPALVLSSTGRP
jgi:hypothetical protein